MLENDATELIKIPEKLRQVLHCTFKIVPLLYLIAVHKQMMPVGVDLPFVVAVSLCFKIIVMYDSTK